MNMFLRLLAPWVLCAVLFLFVQWQWKDPLSYPWPFACILLTFVLTTAFIGYKRMPWSEVANKMGPVFLFLCAVSIASALIEGIGWQWGIALLVAGSVLLSEKLFFLFCFEPSRYPVNALSHVGLALVPLIFFFLARGMSGLWIFLRTPTNTLLLLGAIIAIFALFGACLFRWTMHPSAEQHDRSRWMWFGMIIGVQIAVLVMLLPFEMDVHGTIAALFAAVPLRMRRYAHQPCPSRRMAWFEGLTASGIICSVLLLARWA